MNLQPIDYIAGVGITTFLAVTAGAALLGAKLYLANSERSKLRDKEADLKNAVGYWTKKYEDLRASLERVQEPVSNQPPASQNLSERERLIEVLMNLWSARAKEDGKDFNPKTVEAELQLFDLDSLRNLYSVQYRSNMRRFAPGTKVMSFRGLEIYPVRDPFEDLDV